MRGFESNERRNGVAVKPSFKEQRLVLSGRVTKLGFQIGCFCRTFLPENYTIIA
jgi:hypothetical protein